MAIFPPKNSDHNFDPRSHSKKVEALCKKQLMIIQTKKISCRRQFDPDGQLSQLTSSLLRAVMPRWTAKRMDFLSPRSLGRRLWVSDVFSCCRNAKKLSFYCPNIHVILSQILKYKFCTLLAFIS
jgi:hypothetical protein